MMWSGLPDVTAAELAKVIPEKTARILIYCNNNFDNEPAAFPAKALDASLLLVTDEKKPLGLAGIMGGEHSGIGDQTRFPSLELSCDKGTRAGSCDSGYSCAYQFNLSWRSDTQPINPEVDPRACDPRRDRVVRLRLDGPMSLFAATQKYGVQLAVDKHNAANPGCQVDFKKFDSQGSPDQAPQLARSIVGDASIVGVVGPAFSGESKNASTR